MPVLRNESGPTATVMGIIAHSERGFNFFYQRRGNAGARTLAYPRPLCLMGDEGLKKLSPLLGSSGARNLVPKSGRAPLHFFVLLLTSFGSAPHSLSVHPRFFSHPTQEGRTRTHFADRSFHSSFILSPSSHHHQHASALLPLIGVSCCATQVKGTLSLRALCNFTRTQVCY